MNDIRLLKGMNEEKCPFYRSEIGFKRDLLVRQCVRRPEVWGVGLWPDVATENVAKIIAHLFENEDKNLRAAFVPNDPFEVLYEYNTMFGRFELLPTVFRMFGCCVEEGEFSMHPNMTFGEFVGMIGARKQKMPAVPKMAAYGERGFGRDPVELVVLIAVLNVLCSWGVKYVWYTKGYSCDSLVIAAVWIVLFGGFLLRRGLRYAMLNVGSYVGPIAAVALLYHAVTPKLFLMLGGG